MAGILLPDGRRSGPDLRVPETPWGRRSTADRDVADHPLEVAIDGVALPSLAPDETDRLPTTQEEQVFAPNTEAAGTMASRATARDPSPMGLACARSGGAAIGARLGARRMRRAKSAR